jgi:hypothetical protein
MKDVDVQPFPLSAIQTLDPSVAWWETLHPLDWGAVDIGKT